MHTTTQTPPHLAETARAQGGVLSRPQVLAGGGTQTMLNRLLRNGDWIRLGQGVYSTRPPNFEALCWGGLLLADGPAAVGGLAAAHLRGLCDEPGAS
ncbi:type IV toxin-antitoxin system AbiEi family antitoxin domain-containing protein [Tessaracoccus sp. HDW20]|uniref:type IV toxin-antitoxin system AbiEi family antitoxin domain-containing protein n=1 Tax=Tessaracoccus coleopterorum TaxID=2714950 RepID=UPI0018D41837|nr:type IV toxin-antitoxin system AbiEi family antitoxin domain-containing protein [Tessaracoccus coleopterorum]NHB84118.1 type IV toxin-antitoxin system AbiEi family antitoxin domain-containing protein [Tessaracoccus coleopterorum]